MITPSELDALCDVMERRRMLCLKHGDLEILMRADTPAPKALPKLNATPPKFERMDDPMLFAATEGIPDESA